MVHCITSPIAINDCANAVLAVGAKPIMAEHPREVAGITGMAKSLTVSLANITDARMESILISGRTALELGIPSVIDVVGVACSPLRMELAKRFISECHPAVIKGNTSEIRALAGDAYHAVGIDVGKEDEVTLANPGACTEMKEIASAYARKTEAVVLATGAVDVISDGQQTYYLLNGDACMSKVTGTGCVLTCLIGACLAVRGEAFVQEKDTQIVKRCQQDTLTAAMLACAEWGIAGELADKDQGLGSYHVGLMDQLSQLSDHTLLWKMRQEPADERDLSDVGKQNRFDRESGKER